MNSAWTAWKAYSDTPVSTRIHVTVRALTCPFGPLIDRFPKAGAVLDVGCGHGLLINLLSRDPLRRGLRLCGIDHDAAKIEAARRTALPGVEFSTASLSAFAGAEFDAVSIFDVLYTVRRTMWADILSGCFQALRPGGTLIVKEVVDRPRWKYWAIMAQEMLSVTVFGITKGDRPHFEAPESYRRAIADAGFSVTEERSLQSANWISHYLFIASRM
ncbi:MAG: class I SAM-dependent methyltransferase [Hyphomicrobiales bacterium]